MKIELEIKPFEFPDYNKANAIPDYVYVNEFVMFDFGDRDFALYF